MTAMDLIPEHVREKIVARDDIREDLLAIPEAEADGWIVTFKNGSWANPATFSKPEVVVWSTGRDWRRARVNPSTARQHPPEVFPTLKDALENNVEVLLGRRMA